MCSLTHISPCGPSALDTLPGVTRHLLLILVTQLLGAHRRKDWDGLRKLIHPDAKIGVFAAGGKPVDVETAIAAMQTVHEDVSYRADVNATRVIDDHAVILQGAVERRREGRFVGESHAWLYVFIDGLLHRSEMFGSEQEAWRAYAERGIDLRC